MSHGVLSAQHMALTALEPRTRCLGVRRSRLRPTQGDQTMQPVRILAAVLALVVAGLVIHPAYGAGMAMVRVAHASPNAPAVDVYVDGTRAFTDVKFPQVTA